MDERKEFTPLEVKIPDRKSGRLPERHGNGTNLSFVDGHSEYWKWKAPRTLKVCKADNDYWQGTGRHGDMSRSPGSEDLHNVQKAAWGGIRLYTN